MRALGALRPLIIPRLSVSERLPDVAAHKSSTLRFWRIDGFNCWSAVAGWPEKTGNSPLAQSRRCRLIAVMTAAVR